MSIGNYAEYLKELAIEKSFEELIEQVYERGITDGSLATEFRFKQIEGYKDLIDKIKESIEK